MSVAKNSLGYRTPVVGLVCVAALASTLAAGSAKADCLLSIQPGQDQWLINYEPFAQDEAARSFDVAVINQGDTACSGTLSVDLRGERFGLGQAGSTNRVPYALIDESAGSDLTPRAGQSARRLNARPVNVGPGERSLLRFAFAASTDDLISSGVYSQEAFISVQNDKGLPLAERSVNLAVNVIPAAVMGLKGAFQRNNGVATIDLGDLVAGTKSLDTALYVLSTGGYNVSVSSRNQGQLRQATGNWSIVYSLIVGEHGMNLSAPRDFSVPSNVARFDNYPLSVNIGSIAAKRAGVYSDTITFTVAAI